MSVNDYDMMAAGYSADNEGNVWNALYERPAILALAGDVRGLKVLDAACGSGVHAASLIERGASVSGFDISQGLLAIARRRLGNGVSLTRADLRQPLPYHGGQFDMVLSALALHYVEDWSGPLREFLRILRPGGRLVFSAHHPFMDHLLAKGENYFGIYAFEEVWVRDGQNITMKFWHRPLGAMVQALAEAGFVLERIVEPMPLEAARDRSPGDYLTLTTSPRFIFFSAKKP